MEALGLELKSSAPQSSILTTRLWSLLLLVALLQSLKYSSPSEPTPRLLMLLSESAWKQNLHSVVDKTMGLGADGPMFKPLARQQLFFSSLRLNPLHRSAARSPHIWTTVLDLFLLPAHPSHFNSTLSAIVICLLVSKQPQNEARCSTCWLQGHGTFGLQCLTFFCCQHFLQTPIQLCQPLSLVFWSQNSLKMRPDAAHAGCQVTAHLDYSA